MVQSRLAGSWMQFSGFSQLFETLCKRHTKQSKMETNHFIEDRSSGGQFLLPKRSESETEVDSRRVSRQHTLRHAKPLPFLEEVGPLILFIFSVADVYLVRPFKREATLCCCLLSSL